MNEQEFDMKRARHEVMKFAAQGFYQRRKERLLETAAIELGAKPMKKKYHNYKELQQIRKQQKIVKENRMKQLQENKNFSGLNKYRKKMKKMKKKGQKQKKM